MVAQLRVVGFGPDGDPSLIEEASRLGLLDSIELIVCVTSEECSPSTNQPEFLVVPLDFEGLPMVLLEAMRSGLPPVATNVSGHPDAIDDGVNGLLVPLGDRSALVRCCVDLLQHPQRALQMGGATAKSVAERFDLQDELDSFARLFERLTRHPRVFGGNTLRHVDPASVEES